MVVQEVTMVWAYMHQKGPIAYLLSQALHRGKVSDADAAAPATIAALADLPPKVFTYNFLICVHAVIETVLVLAGALVPLVMNMNLGATACKEELDQGNLLTNMAIGLVGETLVADGIFCVLAARRQRNAHSFLATWRLRPRGSMLVFILVGCVAFLQAWQAVVGEDGMPYVWLYESEQMFGLRLTPRFAVQIHSIEAYVNGTMHETSISKLKEASELDWDAFRENTATLPPCSPPPLPPPAAPTPAVFSYDDGS